MTAQGSTPDQLDQPPGELSSAPNPSVEERVCRAIEGGDIQAIRWFISEGVMIPELRLGPEQLTPLIIACQHIQKLKEIVQLLAECRYDIESCSRTGLRSTLQLKIEMLKL